MKIKFENIQHKWHSNIKKNKDPVGFRANRKTNKHRSYHGKAVLKNKRLMTPSVTDKVKLRLNDMITKLDDSAL